MGNPDNPDVLAVVPLPTPQERRRHEVMLARLMLVAIDHVLSSDGLGLETARDLMREINHAFPEVLLDEGINPRSGYLCCYHKCPRPGAIYIGFNGNPDTHWICFFHYNKWNETRARFLAEHGRCEMKEL